MTPSLPQSDPAAFAKPPRYLVRHSTAVVELGIPAAKAKQLGEGPSVLVRCGDCGRRLFDVVVEREFSSGHGMVPDGSLLVVRKCPSCGLLNEGFVTAEDGKRLMMKEGLAGPWRCECGRSLGFVDEIRGRLRVTCRCKRETRVVAADAVAIAYLAAA